MQCSGSEDTEIDGESQIFLGVVRPVATPQPGASGRGLHYRPPFILSVELNPPAIPLRPGRLPQRDSKWKRGCRGRPAANAEGQLWCANSVGSAKLDVIGTRRATNVPVAGGQPSASIQPTMPPPYLHPTSPRTIPRPCPPHHPEKERRSQALTWI